MFRKINNLGGNHKGCPYKPSVGATLVVALVGVIYLKILKRELIS
jgi:hypothetical protein